MTREDIEHAVKDGVSGLAPTLLRHVAVLMRLDIPQEAWAGLQPKVVTEIAKTAKKPGEKAVAPIEEPACRHRGAPAGTCSCGAMKYHCGLLGIEVRSRRRPGHADDLVCNSECARWEADVQ